MKKMTHFDVLVVYSSYAATSASSLLKDSDSPFSLSMTRNSYDNSYAFFLDTCRRANLSAAFTTSQDITGAGQFSSYWLHNGFGWSKSINEGTAGVIFDKFSPFNARQKKQRELMFSSYEIRPFNEPKLYQLFFDKLSTYKALPMLSIPTVEVKSGNALVIKQAVSSLKKVVRLHANSTDFTDEYILKDRFGSAGQHVYHVKDVRQIQKVLKNKPKIKFILQPMVKFEKGFSYNGISGKIEIRLIFMGKKLVQTYIRIAPTDGFLCNDHQGGKSVYIKTFEIPKKVIDLASQVIEELPPHESLYALDFLISNDGNPYLLEGNTGPGLNWDPENRIEEKKSHELIQVIVNELRKRVETKKAPKEIGAMKITEARRVTTARNSNLNGVQEPVDYMAYQK